MELKNGSHILELDGVRGIAILMVLAAHFTPDVAMGNRAMEWTKKLLLSGWTGVDLFFVLSGFLITGILLRTKGKPQALRIFYARRALRIFPLYFAALIAVFILIPAVMLLRGVPFDPQFSTLLNLQGWTWLHCTNIGMYLAPNHAFQSPVVSISHFWSLSVEEHFYLVWPLLVFLVTRAQLRACCLGIFCVALATRVAGVAAHQNPYYFTLTPFRLDTLAAGGYLAAFAASTPISYLYRKALLVGGLSGTALGMAFIAGHGLWPGTRYVEGLGLTVIAFLFASVLVIVLGAAPDSILPRLCRNPVLRFFGKYSYGIYIIHGLLGEQLKRIVPFAGIAQVTGSAAIAACIVLTIKIGISVLVAMISWRLLEHPALRLKRHFSYNTTVLPMHSAGHEIGEGLLPRIELD